MTVWGARCRTVTGLLVYGRIPIGNGYGFLAPSRLRGPGFGSWLLVAQGFGMWFLVAGAAIHLDRCCNAGEEQREASTLSCYSMVSAWCWRRTDGTVAEMSCHVIAATKQPVGVKLGVKLTRNRNLATFLHFGIRPTYIKGKWAA